MGALQKLALVTGGTRGIGLASGVALLRMGHTVVLAGRSSTLDGAIPTEYRHKAHLMQVDLEQMDGIQPFVDAVRAQHGPVHILVNNAGVSVKNDSGRSNGVLQVGAGEFEFTMKLNALVPMLLTQAVLPDMVEAGWGRVVNVGSLAGRSKTGVSGPAYMMSKAALLAWTRAVALEMGPHGITCNTVAPGRIQTLMAMAGGDETNRRIAEQTPVRRIGSPEEVASAVAYLCRDEAGFTNGACLDVNGGIFMS